MAYPEIMTTEQVAEFLQVTTQHVTRMAGKHKIPGAKKVGYLWRFSRSALEAWFSVSSSTEEETQ
jgi:excisionase family DNA binding protein